MNIFISHNKKDKITARLLATALIQQGVSVWFDEWEIPYGSSLIEKIDEGLSTANVFIILWSKHAAKSRWVSTEWRAYLRKRVEDGSLRVIPIILDDTSLPILLADYKGFNFQEEESPTEIAAKITGEKPDIEIASILQSKINELMKTHSEDGAPFPYLVCPQCSSRNLERNSDVNPKNDKLYYFIDCTSCGWGDWTQ